MLAKRENGHMDLGNQMSGCRMPGSQMSGHAQGIKAAVNSDEGHEHGCPFPDNQADNGEADGGGIAFRMVYGINKINAAHAHDLFRKLGEGWNGSLANTVKIAVNAGMNRCHRDGEGDDPQERGSSWLEKQFSGDHIGKSVYIGSADGGQEHGDAKAGKQRAERRTVITGRCFACHVF